MGVWWSRAAMVTPTVVADSQGTLGMSLGWWVLLAWAQATPTCRYRRSPVGDQPPSRVEYQPGPGDNRRSGSVRMVVVPTTGNLRSADPLVWSELENFEFKPVFWGLGQST